MLQYVLGACGLRLPAATAEALQGFLLESDHLGKARASLPPATEWGPAGLVLAKHLPPYHERLARQRLEGRASGEPFALHAHDFFPRPMGPMGGVGGGEDHVADPCLWLNPVVKNTGFLLKMESRVLLDSLFLHPLIPALDAVLLLVRARQQLQQYQRCHPSDEQVAPLLSDIHVGLCALAATEGSDEERRWEEKRAFDLRVQADRASAEQQVQQNMSNANKTKSSAGVQMMMAAAAKRHKRGAGGGMREDDLPTYVPAETEAQARLHAVLNEQLVKLDGLLRAGRPFLQWDQDILMTVRFAGLSKLLEWAVRFDAAEVIEWLKSEMAQWNADPNNADNQCAPEGQGLPGQGGQQGESQETSLAAAAAAVISKTDKRRPQLAMGLLMEREAERKGRRGGAAFLRATDVEDMERGSVAGAGGVAAAAAAAGKATITTHTMQIGQKTKGSPPAIGSPSRFRPGRGRNRAAKASSRRGGRRKRKGAAHMSPLRSPSPADNAAGKHEPKYYKDYKLSEQASYATQTFSSGCLRQACEEGETAVLEALLPLGCQSADGDMLAATRHGHAGVVRTLIRLAPKSAEQVVFATITSAAAAGDKRQPAAAKAAVAYPSGETALMLASALGSAGAVQLLLAEGAHVSRGNRAGHTALMRAASRGHPTVVQLLLAAGADPKEEDAIRGTALLAASSRGHAHVVRQLVVAKADLQHRGRRGETALHRAAEFGHVNAVVALLELRAQPDARDYLGRTPLLISARSGQALVLRAIASAEQTNLFAKDFAGAGALDLSLAGDHHDVAATYNAIALERKARHRFVRKPKGGQGGAAEAGEEEGSQDEDGPAGLDISQFQVNSSAPSDEEKTWATDGGGGGEGGSGGGGAEVGGGRAGRKGAKSQAAAAGPAKRKAAAASIHPLLAQRGITVEEWAAFLAHSHTESLQQRSPALSRGVPTRKQLELFKTFKEETALKLHHDQNRRAEVRRRWREEAQQRRLQAEQAKERLEKDRIMGTGAFADHSADSFEKDRKEKLVLMTQVALEEVWRAPGGNECLLALLLDAGLDANQRVGVDRATPLMRAASLGSLRLVRQLVGCKAGLNDKDRRHESALMMAAFMGHKPVVRFLLHQKASLNLRNSFQSTALTLASSRGHHHCVSFLLASSSQRAARLAARQAADNSTGLGGMPAAGAASSPPPAMPGATATAAAAAGLPSGGGGGLPVVGRVAGSDLPLDIDAADLARETAATKAAVSGHSELVRLLLRRGARLQAAPADADSLVLGPPLRAGGGEGGPLKGASARGGFPTLVHCAARGDRDTVRVLLEFGVVSARCEEGTEALVQAARANHVGMAALLINSKASVNSRNSFGVSCISQAAACGHDRLLELLLTEGADINIVNESGVAPLVQAAYRGHARCVEVLLRAKANSLTEAKGVSNLQAALEAASERGHLRVLAVLLEASEEAAEQYAKDRAEAEDKAERDAILGRSSSDRSNLFAEEKKPKAKKAEVAYSDYEDEEGNPIRRENQLKQEEQEQEEEEQVMTPEEFARRPAESVRAELQFSKSSALSVAVAYGRKDCVALLLRRGASTDATALERSATDGMEGVVDLLLQAGAPEPRRLRALTKAALWGHVGVLSSLLKSVKSSPQLLSQVLATAAETGHADCVELLLEEKAEVERKTLIKACESGHAPVVAALLNHMPEDAKDLKTRKAAVRAAANKGNANVLLVLLEEGCEVAGDTDVLEKALGRGDGDVVGVLLGGGATAKKQALLEAAEKGQTGIVTHLLLHGAEMEVLDARQRTPLMRAARGGHEQTVIVLLKAGANAMVKDDQGYTALRIAGKNGYGEKLSYLLNPRFLKRRNRGLQPLDSGAEGGGAAAGSEAHGEAGKKEPFRGGEVSMLAQLPHAHDRVGLSSEKHKATSNRQEEKTQN